ncbi:YbjP/YqhG family protein [Hafnia alvei]|mgnify:CR=1 FL=1|uniref:DUF3828 domain-containing protein n=1 Tax=Hafnia alvei TaxID=569 RepID=A0A1C6YWA6_HAFAL|nr:YbjP/YqhG family protein [Hafnia alvei]NLS56121.1 DUF3828 domain-containing protein [Hafnia alvei]SCM51101.1 Protein of unknown function (DUF3828) [Hafnia alvei]
MRLLILLFSFFISGCVHQSAEKRTEDFYQKYLRAYAENTSEIKDDSSVSHDYIAADTARRLTEIHAIREQEITGSDYFTYTQDYAPEWIPLLKVGHARDFMGGKVVDVWLGIEDTKHIKIEVYLRLEDGKWKIYRVRNISGNTEQYIFDDRAIASAKAYAATIPTE